MKRHRCEAHRDCTTTNTAKETQRTGVDPAMRTSITALTAALVASGGLNGYLLLRSPATRKRGPAQQAHETTNAPAQARDITPAPSLRKPVAEPGALPATCEASLARCTDQLNDTEQQLEEYLPLDERFERGGNNPQLEATMEKRVTAALDGLRLQHNLECHGDTCQLELLWKDGKEPGDWMDRLQTRDFRSDLRGLRFRVSEPTHDPVTGEALQKTQVMMRVDGVGTASGIDILNDLVQRFEASGARTRCAADNPDRGKLALRLDVAMPDAPGITLNVGGNLAATGTGRCLVRALRALADATELPPRVSGAVLYYSPVVP